MATTGSMPLHARSPKSAPTATERGLYVGLFLLASVAVLFEGRMTQDVVRDLGHPSVPGQVPFAIEPTSRTIEKVHFAGASAGLRKGDRVIALNGRPLVGYRSVGHLTMTARAGDTISITVLRDGSPVTFAIKAPSIQDFGKAGNVLLEVVLILVMPWLCLGLGFYVAAVRPRDRRAWLLLALLLSFSQAFASDPYAWGDGFRIPAIIFRNTLFLVWPLWMFLFGYYFPEPPKIDRTRPWLKWVLIVPMIVLCVLFVPAIVGIQENIDAFAPWYRAMRWVRPTLVILGVGAVLLGLLLLGVKAKRANRSDSRRRLRLLASGVTAGLVPGLTLAGTAAILGRNPLPGWITIVCLSTFLLFPLTLAYVIVVDRALDLRVVIRQGIQYAAARGGLIVLGLIGLGIFAQITLAIVRNLRGNLPLMIGLLVVMVAITIGTTFAVRRLATGIDRRFFRDAYNAEQILTELSDQVRTMLEVKPLLEVVTTRISDSMHVPRIAVLLRENGYYRPEYARGFDGPPDLQFSADAPTIRHLSESREAAKVYFEDEDSWIYRTPGLTDDERSKLAALGSELLLPMCVRDKLLGFVSVGQKLSEEPYSKSDVRLLQTVAAQTGVALENARLTATIATEIAQRESLAREVEIAREVQERLFPQKLPKVVGLDYNGKCRTAMGVGGDYYDFFSLPGDRFGFAIGDVSGKGIAAALLMATLQGSLRGETNRGSQDLAAMIGSVNRMVYDASTSNRYATFFYGEFDPITRRMDYVNAGHNPPMLFRKDAPMSLLDLGGTVVGLLPNASYEQASIQLQPGDYLIAYTDGISEAMNAGNEEWGEDRLCETARACVTSGIGASETIQRIISGADAFAGGAKQNDDMTLVVLRAI